MATPATVEMKGKQDSLKSVRVAVVAWVLTSVDYFYQYALRSAPAVMMPSSAMPSISAHSVSLQWSVCSDYGDSPFSLIAGTAMDRIGPRRPRPGATTVVGIGALLFATGNRELASVGRFLQGAGGVFGLIGAIYIATTNFAPSRAATLIAPRIKT